MHVSRGINGLYRVLAVSNSQLSSQLILQQGLEAEDIEKEIGVSQDEAEVIRSFVTHPVDRGLLSSKLLNTVPKSGLVCIPLLKLFNRALLERETANLVNEQVGLFRTAT